MEIDDDLAAMLTDRFREKPAVEIVHGDATALDFADSLWKDDPLEVVSRAKAGFLRAWEARTVPA